MRLICDDRRLEVVHVRVPFRRPIQTSAGVWTHRDSWIVRLYTSPYACGVGEAALESGDGDPAEAELRRLAAEAVQAVNAGEWDPQAADLDEAGPVGGAGRAWQCAVESARLGLSSPWSPHLQPSVAVNAAIGFGEADAMAAQARDAASRGFGTLKLKAGPEIDTADLVRRVAAVRRAVGSGVRLRVDVNGAWDVATAGERLAALVPFGLEFVEQPVASHDTGLLAAVRAASPIPIALDESVRSVAAARELLAVRAADVLVVKPSRVGGPAAASEIAGLAAAEGVPVVVSTLFETGVGLAVAAGVAASLPSVRGRTNELAHGLATADLLESDLLERPPETRAGRLEAPDGTGTALDEAALRRYAVEWLGERK